MELLSQATRRWRRASRQRWTNWRISTGAWLWRVWRVSSHAPSSVCPRRNSWSCSCPHPTAPPRSHSPLATTISRRSAPYGGGWVSQHVPSLSRVSSLRFSLLLSPFYLICPLCLLVYLCLCISLFVCVFPYAPYSVLSSICKNTSQYECVTSMKDERLN